MSSWNESRVPEVVGGPKTEIGNLGRDGFTSDHNFAVCGLPKESAKKFILENEVYERKFYTGFLGELNNKIE